MPGGSGSGSEGAQINAALPNNGMYGGVMGPPGGGGEYGAAMTAAQHQHQQQMFSSLPLMFGNVAPTPPAALAALSINQLTQMSNNLNVGAGMGINWNLGLNPTAWANLGGISIPLANLQQLQWPLGPAVGGVGPASWANMMTLPRPNGSGGGWQRSWCLRHRHRQ